MKAFIIETTGPKGPRGGRGFHRTMIVTVDVRDDAQVAHMLALKGCTPGTTVTKTVGPIDVYTVETVRLG